MRFERQNENLHSPHYKLVATSHAVLCRSVGARLLVDACQSVPHMPIDVTSLGCDFMVASGHKMLGPTGVGFVYASYDLLEQMPPWQGGGEMIDEVYLEHSTYSAPPLRFEAGTPAYGAAILCYAGHINS